MPHTSQGHYTGLLQLSQLGPHPQAGQEPGLGALPLPSHRLTHSGTGGCSQARGTAHFTPAQPLPDPVRRLWGRCSLPATSWENLGKPVPALLQKNPLHPQIAWEMVNACRDNAYKEKPVFTVSWGHHWGVCHKLTKTVSPLCQTFRSLGKSLFGCSP